MKTTIAWAVLAVSAVGVWPAMAEPSPPVPAGAHPPAHRSHVGALLAHDVENDEIGDCGVYLRRGNGDLILFDDLDPFGYMKIDGKVVRLDSRAVASKTSDIMVYTSKDGRIRATSVTHITKRYSEEDSGLAGKLTVVVDGDTEVIAITGMDGC